ncbi:ABC transporter permease [Ferrovibrio xuzhouensis]|uniref:ABC transporter permease n=1 Tax=Ferrovibrio xuzhouensis TaxID=1576914 RepID=A0ABV7VJJ1_9PROT
MLLRLSPAITLIVLAVPITLGTLCTILPAFGIFVAIGGTSLSLHGWRELFATPGFPTALRLALTTGVTATALSLLFAVGFCATAAQRPMFLFLRRWLAPLLASPHSAMALGFAFLVMPSGWLMRLLSPWATGFDRPPVDLVTVQDPLGLALVGGLMLKETPYLVLMILAASAQVPVDRTLSAARALGQRPAVAWLKAVFPQIYPQIRLPVFAVLAFSLSVVDVALILGPGSPPPLAVLATRWFADYDLGLYFPAAAAATLQLVLVIFCIVAWRAAEVPLSNAARHWIERGGSDRLSGLLVCAAGGGAIVVGALGLLSLLGMGLWSVAKAWRFPDAFPTSWQIDILVKQADHTLASAGATSAIGVLSVLVALLLTLACLENEQRRALRPGTMALWLLYVPLLVPQIAFLFGVQVLLIRTGLDGTLFAVVWAHVIFVLPYVFLSLADPFRALDPRYAAGAAALGAKPGRIFLAVKLPLLARPVLVAAAVGFAVSVGQYLPTLFAGAGRVVTLTTEAVTLAGGADRRIIGMLALAQSALPLFAYGVALAVPTLLFRNRRDLSR